MIIKFQNKKKVANRVGADSKMTDSAPLTPPSVRELRSFLSTKYPLAYQVVNYYDFC